MCCTVFHCGILSNSNGLVPPVSLLPSTRFSPRQHVPAACTLARACSPNTHMLACGAGNGPR